MSVRAYSVDYESTPKWVLYQRVSRKVHIHIDHKDTWFYQDNEYFNPDIPLSPYRSMYTDKHDDIKKQIQDFQKDLNDILQKVKDIIIHPNAKYKSYHVSCLKTFDYLDKNNHRIFTLRYRQKENRENFYLEGDIIHGKYSINGNKEDIIKHISPQMYACLRLPYL